MTNPVANVNVPEIYRAIFQPKLLLRKVDHVGVMTPAILTAVITNDQLDANVSLVLNCFVNHKAVGNSRP